MTFHNACRAVSNLSNACLNNKFDLEKYKVLPQYQRKQIMTFNAILFQRIKNYKSLQAYNPDAETKPIYLRRLKNLLIVIGGSRAKSLVICNSPYNYDTWVRIFFCFLNATTL